jgi:hypothetical protein
VFLRRYYVLFFIAHASRRVCLAGCSKNPSGAWASQQARNLGLDFSEQRLRFLIRDRDRKYSGAFDEVFRSEGARIVMTPVRAPKANAIAERFVRTVRDECLDWLLILNRRHLERVLRVYVDHYNRERPHRALELRPPDPDERLVRPPAGKIRRHDKRSPPGQSLPHLNAYISCCRQGANDRRLRSSRADPARDFAGNPRSTPLMPGSPRSLNDRPRRPEVCGGQEHKDSFAGAFAQSGKGYAGPPTP